MNQSIIFSDNEYYDDNLQQIVFQAQCQGRLIRCIVSLKTLVTLNGQLKITDGQQDTEDNALTLFDVSRFDIENLTEKLIEKEAFNDDGNVYLNHY